MLRCICVAALVTAACYNDSQAPGTGGTGGAVGVGGQPVSTSSSSSAGFGGASPMPCSTWADCPWNPCAPPACEDGFCIELQGLAGTRCVGGWCDANGQCVWCIPQPECPDLRCAGVPVCKTDDYCNNGVADPSETDTDCGGSCPPCADSKRCLGDWHCSSGICYMGICNSAGETQP